MILVSLEKKFKRLIQQVKLRHVFYLLILYLVCKVSFGKAFESYFWKDDWALLWSANYNPADFYWSTVGGNWLVRTGVFMHPYVLFFHKIIRDSETWQLIRFVHKYINSLLFFYFMYSVTKNKSSGALGGLLHASYSGGIESYTWHTPTGLATSFILLAFTFYNFFLEKLNSTKFLEKVNKKSYFLFLLFTLLSFFSYIGRTAGLVMVSVF